MEEESSAHYALKIAVTILRERCQLFQRRISVLEEENVNLKLLCQKNNNNQDSLTQIDSLKRQIASVDEENSHLQSKIKIMSQENQQLWANLGKLTHVNKSLGSHLNKINDTLSQHVIHHQPLIRSKTFTQDKPQTEGIPGNFKQNELIKLDLEDVSLKLISSMSEVKNEMDSLVQNMTDVEILDNIITSSLGFSYEDENDDIVEDLKIILEELTYIKSESEKQHVFLKESLENIRNKKANLNCDNCIKIERIKLEETMENNLNISNQIKEENTSDDPKSKVHPNYEKMCPVCSQQFAEEVPFPEFLSHVESHFKTDVSDTNC